MNELQPWRESAHTQIWNITESARKYGTLHPQDDASLAVWLVHAPWMHPFWCWHYAGLIHLRDLPGHSEPAIHTLEGSTHELIAMAVDPVTPPDLRALDWDRLQFLRPISIVQQFIAATDADALGRIEAALSFVVKGQLSLDSDGRRAWENVLLWNRSQPNA